MRNGNGQAITIYDPFNVAQDAAGNWIRQPFAGNRIPRERMDPVALNMLQYWPQPNAVPTNQFTNQNNFFTAGKGRNNDNRFDSRLDHNISEHWRLWARGSYSKNSNFPFNGFGNIATPIGDGNSRNHAFNIALNSVYTFNPSTILNFGYGFARKINHKDPFSRGVDLRGLGFPDAVAVAAAEQVTALCSKDSRFTNRCSQSFGWRRSMLSITRYGMHPEPTFRNRGVSG